MSQPALPPEILAGYFDEVRGYVPVLTKSLEKLSSDPRCQDRKNLLEEIRRLSHTIKGASAMVGVSELSRMAERMETAALQIMEDRLAMTPAAVEAMRQTAVDFGAFCHAYQQGGVEEGKFLETTIRAFEELEGAAAEPTRDAPDTRTHPAAQKNVREEQGESASPGRSEQGRRFVCSKDPDIPDELLNDFFQEADEHVAEIEGILEGLHESVQGPTAMTPGLREDLRRIRRAVHTLKGSGAIMGLKDFSRFAHAAEDLLDWLYETAEEINPDILEMVTDSLGVLENYLEAPQHFTPEIMEDLVATFKEKSGEVIGPESGAPEHKADSQEIDEPLSEEAGQAETPSLEEKENSLLQEASVPPEHRRAQALRVDMETVDSLVNLAEEIMIASGAMEQKLTKLSLLLLEMEAAGERLKSVARDINERLEVRALEQFGAKATDGGETADGVGDGDGLFDDFDDLELDRYSRLNVMIRSLDESAIDVATLSARLSELSGEMDGQLNRERVVLGEFRDRLAKVRMVPLSALSHRLKRTVREACAALGKKVRLEISGEETELDRLVWDKLADPLMHLLRNAVDHGIESEEKRRKTGKPETGEVKLSARRQGNQVVIRIEDDGDGIDYDAIRESEQWRKHREQYGKLSDDPLTDFIFRPGFSTSDGVTEISGRGMGLDVVRENVRQLKGVVKATSQKGEGARFTIRLPLTLAAAQVLIFKAYGKTCALPLGDIREIMRIHPGQIESEPERFLASDGKKIPLYFFEELWDSVSVESDIPRGTAGPLALSVAVADLEAAILIDELVARKEVVVKSLGAHFRGVKGVAGAAILGDGSVAPVLNLPELLAPFEKSFNKNRKKHPRTEPSASAADILVVDDSVSIRHVVSKMLADRGWTARTAANGMEAIDRLREKTCDLIVMDIEMPRMNGFECLSALKNQDEFKDIPVVMLTSRTARKHRQKAKALGASGFMVKPYNEKEFVAVIRDLLGNTRHEKQCVAC